MPSTSNKGRQPVSVGSRLEVFWDEYLIEGLTGAGLRLHRPVPQEVALVCDRPWEGNMCGYVTVFQDGDRCRMYYKGESLTIKDGKCVDDHPLLIAYAESADGIRWHRPELGLLEFEGSTRNNIVWFGPGEARAGAHGFAPFKDENPACGPGARYKAVGADLNCQQGLFAMHSPDGLRWSLIRPEPILTTAGIKANFAFDSQNLAFWDAVRGEYRLYFRDWREGGRGIRTAVSTDFLNWSAPEWLEYPGAPVEQLYTNQVIPYSRAPHVFVGFPTRYVERKWSEAVEALPELEHRRLRSSVSERYGAALTDGLFMSSRDGRTFRRWPEAFVRPGPQLAGNWAYGDNYQNWGLIETPSTLPGAPPEISLYVTENYWRAARLRRWSIRVDGFVSVAAPLAGGELVTRPLIFQGRRLVLNFSASAAGCVQVEVLPPDAAAPLPGLALSDCVELLGDDLARPVRWRSGADLARLAGKPIRLRCVLKDADLFSMRFAD